MDIKVNQAQQVAQTEAAKPAEQSSEAFRFALMSNIEEADLQERLTNMMNEITMQGSRIKKKKTHGFRPRRLQRFPGRIRIYRLLCRKATGLNP